MSNPELIRTVYTILQPDGTPTNGVVMWPENPGYERIRELTNTILGVDTFPERVVYRKADGGVADMLVDEDGHNVGQQYNTQATAHYRRDWMLKNPGQNPDFMHHIVGIAIVFDRKVWY
uniref:Uncharacterized protein n=1 Tax=Pseudomonas phage Cygsa01 TaxID=3138529 RepID=A0AAU6W4R5_9VIRU